MALVRSPINKTTELRLKANEERQKVPINQFEKPVIDYGKLRDLCHINGLKSRDSQKSTAEAHAKFMESFNSVFVQPDAMKGLPIHSETRSKKHASEISKSVGGNTLLANKEASLKRYPVDELTHDIRDYLPALRNSHPKDQVASVKADKIKLLRKYMRILPFERTADNNREIESCLKVIPQLSLQVSPEVLKELCVVAQLDIWKDDYVTIFGNSGWHLILKGSVETLSKIRHRKIGESVNIPCPTPDLENPKMLAVGDSFGTFVPVEGRTPNSKVLAVQTLEENCEILSISCANYNKVIERMRQHDEKEKVVILQSCKTFNLWSQQSLSKVASLLEWETFSANTLLVSEGYKSPFVGIIKSGECHVLRSLSVVETRKDGKKDTRTEQVVMGKLGPSDSFGEISLVANQVITCSIMTASEVVLGCIVQEKLQELDDVTLQLLHQSGEATFGDLTEDDIQQEYIKQAKQSKWNEFKHEIIIDVINSRGIRPGYGKWAKP